MISYAVTLSDALTPITLISGVGLLLLAMTARYNYTTDRVRALLKERRQKAPAVDPVLEKAIRLTYERSHLLKNAILAVTTSAHLSGLNLEVWKSTMLLTAVVFIVVSTIFFVLEIQISLKTIHTSIRIARGS